MTTTTTIILAFVLMLVIPIASSTFARLIHFTLGLQGVDFNLQAIFGKLGFWFLMESKNKAVNLFKDAVTCIYCLTHHITVIETIVAYTLLFGYWGLLAVFIVPAIALTLQQILQFYVYQPYFTAGEEESTESINQE